MSWVDKLKNGALIEAVKAAKLEVSALETTKFHVDRDLKAAKLRLREAEDDLAFARQLRMF